MGTFSLACISLGDLWRSLVLDKYIWRLFMSGPAPLLPPTPVNAQAKRDHHFFALDQVVRLAPSIALNPTAANLPPSLRVLRIAAVFVIVRGFDGSH